MKKYAIIIFVFMVSCTPDVKMLKIHKAFVYDNYSSKNFYILPAVNKTGEPGFDASDLTLEAVLKDKIKTIRITGSQESCRRLGKMYSPGYINELISEYKSGSPSYKNKIKLLSGYLTSGYLVISEFGSYTTREYRTSTATDGKNHAEITNNVESAVSGSFFIFEMTEGGIVYHADHVKTLTSSSSYEEKVFFKSLLNDIFSSSMASYSAYVPEDFTEAFYGEIIDNIPGKGDNIEKILKKDNHYELQ